MIDIEALKRIIDNIKEYFLGFKYDEIKINLPKKGSLIKEGDIGLVMKISKKLSIER